MTIKTKLIIAGVSNLIDTIATLIVVNHYGFVEVNPIMAWLLQWPAAFVSVKILLATALFLFVWNTRSDKHANAVASIAATAFICIATYYLICIAVLQYLGEYL